jgi:carbamoyltransferase
LSRFLSPDLRSNLSSGEILWGLSFGGHDAALTVVDGTTRKVLFASQAERFSRRKNDPHLNEGLIREALAFGTPGRFFLHEHSWIKKSRQLWAGQFRSLRKGSHDMELLARIVGRKVPHHSVSHHESHAAAGFFTSGFHEAAVLVLDAIGEWETASIWGARADRLQRLWSRRYPQSLGLWYSALTQRCGLKPNEEEYILMGMAAYGDPARYRELILRDLISVQSAPPFFRLKTNLHRGAAWWRPEIDSVVDLAAATQSLFEEILLNMTAWVQREWGYKKLVFVGGCALNCAANYQVLRRQDWDGLWIFPNPGDAGSSLGAVAAALKTPLNWPGPFTGHEITRTYDPAEVAEHILKVGYAGVATGRGEFGPRALGNRSLLADPRTQANKDRVNDFKGRERFRPFAPAVLEECADEYFDLSGANCEYMQFAVRCKQPERIPATVHVDGTSRVQVVKKATNPLFHALLGEWHRRTGCPVLLNTSLNVKGEPLVNTEEEAKSFHSRTGVEVFPFHRKART